MAGRIRGVRHGLAVVLQMGMATWLSTVSFCTPIADPVAERDPTDSGKRLPDERRSAFVDILATLALNRFTEVHT